MKLFQSLSLTLLKILLAFGIWLTAIIFGTTRLELATLRLSGCCNFLKLESEDDIHTQRGFTIHGIEYGEITIQNEETVKYWFKSHHISKTDEGGTLFAFSDRSTFFLPGYFCCEVALPNGSTYADNAAFKSELAEMEANSENFPSF